ncbi:MAG TPA: hypothetical protein VFZ74_01465 [Burkholderiales bacterium]
MKRTLLCVAGWAFLLTANAAFEVNGVPLGGSESDIRERFPSAHCKALEWSSLAADRRCDDSRASIGGVKARITFYLRKDAVEAFDVRFDTSDLERFVGVLKKSFGKPVSEGRQKVEREGRAAREFYRAQWKEGNAQAQLRAETDKRRAALLVYRGDFEEEIYRVR